MLSLNQSVIKDNTKAVLKILLSCFLVYDSGRSLAARVDAYSCFLLWDWKYFVVKAMQELRPPERMKFDSNILSAESMQMVNTRAEIQQEDIFRISTKVRFYVNEGFSESQCQLERSRGFDSHKASSTKNILESTFGTTHSANLLRRLKEKFQSHPTKTHTQKLIKKLNTQYNKYQ